MVLAVTIFASIAVAASNLGGTLGLNPLGTPSRDSLTAGFPG